jgi:hypothetical protein
MGTDGHGYIGKLLQGDGRCLNVSLPDETSKKLIESEPRLMEVRGRWLPYVKDYGTVVTVNGRRIGEGHCGNHYLFVR